MCYSKWISRYNEFGDVSVLDTPTFFFGMTPGEEIKVNIEEGKMLVIKLVHISEPDETACAPSPLNSTVCPVKLPLRTVPPRPPVTRKKADKSNPGEVGATLSGSVVKVDGHQGPGCNQGHALDCHRSHEDGNHHRCSYERYRFRNPGCRRQPD
jgi:pyruvate carboxylase